MAQSILLLAETELMKWVPWLQATSSLPQEAGRTCGKCSLLNNASANKSSCIRHMGSQFI